VWGACLFSKVGCEQALHVSDFVGFAEWGIEGDMAV
jgi:hypothetical protein